MSNLKNSKPYGTVTGAVSKARDIMTRQRYEVRRTQASLMPDDMKQAAIKRATDAARKELEQLQPLVDGSEAIVIADAQRQLFRSGAQSSPVEALLSHMEQDSEWRRIERRLDHAKDGAHKEVQDIAKRAAKSGDLNTLRALRAEVPDYFAAKGEAATGEALIRDIEGAWSTTFTADQQATHADMQAFEKGAKRVKVALSQAAYLLDRPDEDAVLPLFTNETITIPGVSAPTVDERVNVYRNLDPSGSAVGAAQAAGNQAEVGGE